MRRIEAVRSERLTELDLSNDQFEPLTRIPEKVFQLEHLEVLDLRGNNITSLSVEVANLKRLKALSLAHNRLKEVPPAIKRLKDLEALDLSNNELTAFPLPVGDLVNLRELDLSQNKIAEISPTICKLAQLRHLDLSKNDLQDLPIQFGELGYIQQLNLRNNQFKFLPDAIYDLKKLQYLYIGSDREGGNSIDEISSRIVELEHLKFLDLAGNPIEVPPPEIVRRGVEAVREYFRQLTSEGTDHLYEAKLLIIGEAGAGKTTLAKKIVDPTYSLHEEDSTRGIDVLRWKFPLDGERTFQVNIWDFGGQEIYHATHQFFLTKRSVYVLVADMRQEDTDFFHWLNVADLLSDGSPLIIIKNEKQDRRREIDERALRAQFGNLVRTLGTNLADNRGLSEVRDEIQHQIIHLPHVGTLLPSTWVRVREALERDTRNHISLDEYIAICEMNDFAGLKSKLQLSGYLHDLGVCLHFQDDPLLRKTVILKPKWGTDAAYKILDNINVLRNLGRFTRADLAAIWSGEEHAGMHDELLQLMMKFRLCYPLPEKTDTFIAPQLLSGNPPDYLWDSANNLLLRYTYDFMPKGILTQLIVIMHAFIVEQRLVWKTGVLLTLDGDGAIAEVREHYDQREIRICVAGKDSRRLLVIVSHELDKIHSLYPRLKCTRLVPCNCNSCKENSMPHFYRLDILRRFFEDNQVYIQCQASYSMVKVQDLLDNDGVRYQVSQEEVSVKNMPGERVRLSVFSGSLPSRYSVEGDGQTGQPKAVERVKRSKGSRSAWASGSFYLFAFVTVVATVAALAKTVSAYIVPVLLIAGAIFVPLIGVLQLRMDGKLDQKPFLAVVRMVIRQLPLIRKILDR